MDNVNKNSDRKFLVNVDDCNKVLSSIKTVLLEKNRRYGNSALEPLNVFYKGDASNSILIRLDDKLSRIKNSSELRKNDLYDLLGYCILLLVSWDYENTSFEDKVDKCINRVKSDYFNGNCHEDCYIGQENFKFNGFSKNNKNNIIDCLNGVCGDIKKSSAILHSLVYRLIDFLTIYFIENNITDFSDLID